MKNIVGRAAETQLLKDMLQSNHAEFMAVYGRRRVGKTFLVQQFFAGKPYFMQVSGSKDGKLNEQLENFITGLSNCFFKGIELPTPQSWRKAFRQLTQLVVENVPKNKQFMLFLDELPWLSTKKSRFLQMLDYFWNTEWSALPNFKLIVCGSAASWMLDNLVHATGGLYNRLTQTMHLKPFDLHDTQKFLKSLGFKYSQKQIIEACMLTGGVAHYLKMLKKSKSPAQNIQALCFDKNAPLRHEFVQIFKALFEKAEDNQKIVQALAGNHNGLTREGIIAKSGLSSGGTLTKRLQELEAAGFIQSYTPIGKAKKDACYRVIDNYSLFYTQWIAELEGNLMIRPDYWQQQIDTGKWHHWSGYAFENICFHHLWPIMKALEIDDVVSVITNWRVCDSGSGAEIDLILIRKDKVVTLIEIKGTKKPFVIDKAYAQVLMKKTALFQTKYPEFEQVELAFITSNGLKQNVWSEELVDKQVNITALFH